MLLLYKDEILREVSLKYPKTDDNLVEIVVFGSVARDEYTPISDIDLLFVTTDKQKTRKLFSSLREKLFTKYGILITAIYVTPNEYANSIEPLYTIIKKEGRVIWRRKKK